MEVTEISKISSSELSSPVNRKSISLKNKSLESNRGVTETATESNSFKKKKKKKHQDFSQLENMLCNDSSLQNNRSREVTEIRSCQLSSPVIRKSISLENTYLEENSEIAETVRESNYLKKREKKQHHDSSRCENMLHRDSLLKNGRSREETEIGSYELSSPVNRSISSENKCQEKISRISETVNESKYFKKREKDKYQDSSRLENLLHHDLSQEKDTSSEIIVINSSELSSPVSRKFISSGHTLLKKNSEVSETVNASKYLKKRKKQKRHDSSLEVDRSLEVSELCSSEISSSVNRKSISSGNKSLNNNGEVSEIVNGTRYFKKRKKVFHHSSRLENEVHYDSSLENDRSMDVTDLRNSKVGSNYLKKRKKKKHHDSSSLENMLHHGSSQEKDMSSEGIVISSIELSPPVNRKSISTEHKLLKKSSEVSETVNASNYLKKKKKQKCHDSTMLENVIHYDSSLEKKRNVEANEMFSSLLSSSSISSENGVLSIPFQNKTSKKSRDRKAFINKNINPEVLKSIEKPSIPEKVGNTFLDMFFQGKLKEKNNVMEMNPEYTVLSKMRKSEFKQTNNNLISNKVSENNLPLSLLSPSHQKKNCIRDESMSHINRKLPKNLDQNKPQVSNATNRILEEGDFENSISPSERKLQKNNSLMNKCEGRNCVEVKLSQRKGKKTYGNQSTTQIIEDIDTDSLVEKSGFNSSSERKKRKREEINCEGFGVKLKKKKMQKQTNENAADICMFEQSPSLPSPFKHVGNDKRKKKHRHALQDECSTNQDEASANLCAFGREPPFTMTSQILEKNKSVLCLQKNNNIPVWKVFPNLTTSTPHKMFKEHINTKQMEPEVGLNGSINTELFESGSKLSQLFNRENGTQKEINSEYPLLTSKEKEKQRDSSRNATFQPELGSSPSSQPLLWKRKIKNKRNNNTFDKSCDENFVSAFCASESKPFVKSIGTNREEIETSFENSIISPKENKLHKQTNDITICNASENSPSSVLPSSHDEMEKNANKNLNVLDTDSDNESVYDIFACDSERFSSTDLLNFYANKLGNKKEECDKIWNDAATAEFGKSALQNFCETEVIIRHDIPLLHLADCSICAIPTKEERKQLIYMGMKQTPFDKSEDAIIMKNWQDLCEDNSVSPSVLLVNVTKRVGGYKNTKKRIVQYLGHGLPDRALYQIYHRFILLSCSKRGLFTEEEDYILLKAVNSQIKEKYAILSSILRRSRNTIYKRHRSLLTFPIDTTGNYEKMKNKWNIKYATKVVRSLMHVSGKSSIEDFKDAIISAGLWRQMEKDMNIPHWKLHNFWIYKLHVQLFAETPVCDKQLQKKIVEWLYQKNYSTEKEIVWSESKHLLSGSTSSFMWLQFRSVKSKFKFQNFNGLRDFVTAVYTQRDAFDGASRYLTRYKVNDDFSLTVVSGLSENVN